MEPSWSGVLHFCATHGYESVAVMKAKGAVEAAKKGKFDLIILDVVLQDMSGYQAAQQINDALGENCPHILIMTSRNTKKELGLVLMSGATAVLQKPFRMVQLEKIVPHLIGKKRKSKKKD